MKQKQILGYLFFFLVSFFIFAFLLFPGEKAASHLSAGLTEKYTPLEISIQSIELNFPLGMDMETPAVLLDEKTQIQTDLLKITFDFLSVFGKEKKINFHSGFYQGLLKGRMVLNAADPFLISQAEMSLSDIKINGFKYQTALADITLDLKLGGEYSFSDTKKTPGKGALHIKDLTAAMNDSLFNTINVPLVDFSTIQLEFIQTNNKLTLTSCLAKGSIINMKLTGDIELALPLETSRLDLKGTLLPDSIHFNRFANAASPRAGAKRSTREGIKFNIRGTLEKPSIQL